MGCRLVYALVLNTTLQGTVEAQAARIVDALAASVAHTMALEGQAVQLSAASKADHVDDVIRSGRLWSASGRQVAGERFITSSTPALIPGGLKPSLE